MNLNRQNYEEFFLLYADHELSAQDRKTVDCFVQANPDLQEELLLLCQLRIKPEPAVQFEPKSALYRHTTQEDFAVQGDPMQMLLLYLDGELDAENKAGVEDLIAQDDRLNQELALLRQTRLTPDQAVVFPHKDLLYKRQSGTSPRGIWWLRAAAAAVVLLAASWLIVDRSVTQRRPANRLHPDLISSPRPQPIGARKTGDLVTSSSAGTLHNSMIKKSLNRIEANRQLESKRNLTSHAPVAQQRQEAAQDDGAEASATAQRAVRVTLPRVTQPAERSIQEPTASLGQGTEPLVMELMSGAQVVTGQAAAAKNVASAKVGATAMDELAQNREDDINFFVFSTNKNSMRGLVRKVSRVFDKMTNADDENKRGLLVGNFQIPLK
jgi:hypothetical protein